MTIRWLMLLLAGLDWPVVYSIKLGQVGPILLLLFVLGWRWLDATDGPRRHDRARRTRQAPATAARGLGGADVGAWRTAAVAIAVFAAACLLTLPVVGIGAWTDYVSLLRAVSEPVTTPHNFTVGAVVYQAGVPTGVATTVQWVSVAMALALVVVAARRLSLVAGFVVAVVATQLVSPLLWDHYAIVLLLPTAWLLANGARWAVAIPLATSLLLLPIAPAAVYPLVFWVSLVAPFVVRPRAAGTS